MMNSSRFNYVLLLIFLLAACGCEFIMKPPPTATPLSPTVQPTPSQPVDTVPPEVKITAEPREANSSDITLNWTGNDNRSTVSNLLYSYFLEGLDKAASAFSSNATVTYKNLASGNYTFYVNCKDEAGNISPTPASYKFTIAGRPPPPTGPLLSQNSFLIVPGSEVNQISVGAFNNVVYALDAPNGKLYKSDTGGIGWTSLSRNISGAAPWYYLASAPDNPDVVAVVTDAATEVYLSIDGGQNFGATQLASKLNAGERVRCIALSPSSDGISRDLAVGTTTNSGHGRVLINVFRRLSGGWLDSSTGISGWTSPSISGVDVFALKYSPSFGGDGNLLAIVSSTADTYLYIGIRDLATSSITWNSYSGYPVELCAAGQDTPGTPLMYADIALPADYAGGSSMQNHIFACWSNHSGGTSLPGTATDDVYRIDNTMVYRLGIRPDVISSLAFYGTYGRGKLLAGAAGTSSPFGFVQIYFTANPQAPVPIWQQSQKPPTGPGNARVGWSADGSTAFCGTGSYSGTPGDQSAFSRSTNNGLTWNQVGLIDT
jgi:hypothetical protein